MLAFLSFWSSYGVFLVKDLSKALFKIWQVAFTTSAKVFRQIIFTKYSSFYFLKSSIFFSKTPFNWGCPLCREFMFKTILTTKCSNSLFSNSPSWPLLTLLILNAFSCWVLLKNLINWIIASSLLERNKNPCKMGKSLYYKKCIFLTS